MDTETFKEKLIELSQEQERTKRVILVDRDEYYEMLGVPMDVASARRLYHHHFHGGTLSNYDVSRLVATIEILSENEGP